MSEVNMLVHVLMALKLSSQLFIQAVHLNIIIGTQSFDQPLKRWRRRPGKEQVLRGRKFHIFHEKWLPLAILSKQQPGM